MNITGLLIISTALVREFAIFRLGGFLERIRKVKSTVKNYANCFRVGNRHLATKVSNGESAVEHQVIPVI
jgi:hypothetical protein